MTSNPCEMNSCRGCNQNLSRNDPASQYQRQKIIQNTVRVYASLYTMNLAGLASYQKPLNVTQLVEQAGTQYVAPPYVYWNQMSDRARPANQLSKVASGSTYHTSSIRHTITRNRPGAMSPGGVGVDIKHNSYDRYLNKIKGKAPLRRGIITPNFGAPIIFNRAFPIYGGKVVKTSIINGCDCPDTTDNFDKDKLIYGSTFNALQDQILAVRYTYNVGDFVWAKKLTTDDMFYKGEIINIENQSYTVKFEDDGIIQVFAYCDLFQYFDCNGCGYKLNIREAPFKDFPNQKRLLSEFNSEDNVYCNILSII